MDKENRVAVIGIVVSNREELAKKVNEILSNHGHIIVGRMGIPYKERDISVISIIVDGTTGMNVYSPLNQQGEYFDIFGQIYILRGAAEEKIINTPEHYRNNYRIYDHKNRVDLNIALYAIEKEGRKLPDYLKIEN